MTKNNQTTSDEKESLGKVVRSLAKMMGADTGEKPRKYLMSDFEKELADDIEMMQEAQTTLHQVVWAVREASGQLLAAIRNRENDIEWIINDQSTRRMYDLLLKGIKRMKEVVKREGFAPWDGTDDYGATGGLRNE